MDLRELLRRHEGKTLEFKRDLSSPGLVKTVIAFANTAGGDLVIGVDDGNRDVVGVADALADEERLANLIADRIAPTVLPDIEIVAWRSTNVLVARIADSPLRPHHVKSEGPQGGVYVRVGSSSRRAGPELIQEMGRYVRSRSFDEEPYPESNPEDIDFRAASESFADLRRLRRADLQTLRILTSYQGRVVPTVGGLVLFGRDRLRFFPDAWIRVGLFGGVDRTRIQDSKDITSNLPLAVEETIEYVQRMTPTSLEIEGARHTPLTTYPLPAIREAIVNAAVHADYSQKGAAISVALFSDRIEIENPGLLPFGLTLEDIQEGTSKLRNRVIGRAFKELGLIEQWGSGVQRMTNACREAGLTDPFFEERAMSFRVTMHSMRIGEARLDRPDAEILDVLHATSGQYGLTTSEIAKKIERSDRAARTRLLKLVERGLIVRVGSNRNDPKARWFLARPKSG
jgi:ATP-dependent DNA helicase RecG